MPSWMEKLRRYPKWKMLKIFDDYIGPLNHRVFEFLEVLELPPVDYDSAREDQGYTKQLPDLNNFTKLERECGAKLFNGLARIMATAEPGMAEQKINELHAELREEYPRFAESLKL